MMTRRKGKCKMKTKITKKAIMSTYRNVIKVGYCDMQDALKWCRPNFYTAGVYGWNADVYVIDYDTVIVTGYRPFGNVELPHEVIDMLNKCAKSITRYFNYDLAKIYLKNNLDELVRGIEYDFYSYNFASADENVEIKRK
jgi:hypothetical protein|nr:MAG TPA: hypothetical protein [Caudoviricetes sp.]